MGAAAEAWTRLCSRSFLASCRAGCGGAGGREVPSRAGWSLGRGAIDVNVVLERRPLDERVIGAPVFAGRYDERGLRRSTTSTRSRARNCGSGTLFGSSVRGDVIPEGPGPVVEARQGTEEVWKMPTTCAACGTEVVRDEGEVIARCRKPSGRSQRLCGLIYFTGRGGMDTRGREQSPSSSWSRRDWVPEPAGRGFRGPAWSKIRGLSTDPRAKSAENLLTSPSRARASAVAPYDQRAWDRDVGWETVTSTSRDGCRGTYCWPTVSRGMWLIRRGSRTGGRVASAQELMRGFGVGKAAADSISPRRFSVTSTPGRCFVTGRGAGRHAERSEPPAAAAEGPLGGKTVV